MRQLHLALLVLLALVIAPAALGQARPYIGFVYPAGGQQGTTFQVRLGGQNMDDLDKVLVSGNGVTAKVVDYLRRLNPQENQLINEQLRIVRRGKKPAELDEATARMVARIEQRMAENVNRPACNAIASVAIIEITMAKDAPPGRRELTLVTQRGVSNPLVFFVGQIPETSRKPMKTAEFQVLGKENLAQRRRPDDEVEKTITLPCTINGQIASGEINRYRFEAKKGQKLVFASAARQLNPYVADAVPGWFQPVLKLTDAEGREVAYNDDYRFKPDPVILCEVPKDGEYLLEVTDAIYRGREDFVYRVSIGELPFVTSMFPLGAQAGSPAKMEFKGWNLQGAKLLTPGTDAVAGTYSIAANRSGMVSNFMPFEIGELPEIYEKETNDEAACAEKISLPVMINGRINRSDDADVYALVGKAGQTIVADVDARRLDSPIDSFVKITDASGAVLAFNDDQEDAEAGSNTHDADSYVMVKLPADGTYYVHVTDTARAGGDAYAYRLRVSEPKPDFALRVVPSSASMRAKSTANVTVHILRKDGFTGAVQLSLKNPPAGISSSVAQVGVNQFQGRLTIRGDTVMKEPVDLVVQGQHKIGQEWISRVAVPAEDRMQAFLWRHLVPAESLKVLVYDPAFEPQPRRVARQRPTTSPTTQPADASKPKFTRQQVQARLRQLKLLFEEELIAEEFYHEKVAECESSL